MMNDVDFFTREAKRLAEDLHHEARLERIVDIIEKAFSNVWLDGYTEGFSQGREGLQVIDSETSIGDATGEP